MDNLTAMTDEQIVKFVREKNSELYREIVKRYQPRLYSYILRLCKNHDETEDILQSAFIKAFKNLNSFDLKRKFSSWIYRIAHNEAINHFKKHRKERVALDDIATEMIDEKIDITESLDKKILKKEFSGYLDQLKIKYREPLILFYQQEKSYEEISDILRIPINTVGTLISRGKQQIKQLITKNGKA